MIKKIFTLIMISGFGAFIYRFIGIFTPKEALSPVSAHYIANGSKELGGANIVTSVVVTYRGLDTLGEVTVLFAAAAVVGLLIKLSKDSNPVRKEGSELLKTGSALLVPLITLFGIYVFVNGHLTPGGGFQGGAIIATGLVLNILANPNNKFGHTLYSIIESISGGTYIAIGLIGLTLGANNFLDNRIIPLGEYGTLISAGIIPVIYILIGLKVGAELSSVVVSLSGKSNKMEEEV